MYLTLLTSCSDSCLSVHFVLLTPGTSQALSLPLFKYYERPCLLSTINPAEMLTQLLFHFSSFALYEPPTSSLPFKPSLKISLDTSVFFKLSCFSDCFEMCFSRILSEPARAETVCCLLGPSLGLPLSWLHALLLPLIRHSVCIHSCPCPPSFF